MPILPLLIALMALLLPDRGQGRFTAALTGAAEVPPVETAATGAAEFGLNGIGTGMSFRLTVANIANVTAAHIHLGEPGENGPVVVTLFSPPAPVTVRGRRTVARGTITAADLQGELEGEPLLDLIAEMLDGNTYVNVHTTAFPEGAIRGQIVPELPGDGGPGA